MEGSSSAASNPYAAPKAPLSNPRPASTGAVLANPWMRLGAVVLDGIVFSALLYGPLFATGFGAALAAVSHGGAPAFTGALLVGLLTGCAGLIVWIVLTIMFVARNGQTIGKKIVGIKVVRRDFSKAGLGRIFWLRNVVNGLIGSIPVLGWIYTLVDALMVFSESRQCIHDRIADTLVVEA